MRQVLSCRNRETTQQQTRKTLKGLLQNIYYPYSATYHLATMSSICPLISAVSSSVKLLSASAYTAFSRSPTMSFVRSSHLFKVAVLELRSLPFNAWFIFPSNHFFTIHCIIPFTYPFVNQSFNKTFWACLCKNVLCSIIVPMFAKNRTLLTTQSFRHLLPCLF